MLPVRVVSSAVCGLIISGLCQAASAETIRLSGGPMKFDTVYGIMVNEGSSLKREALIVQDKRLPARITDFDVQISLYDNWQYEIDYSVEFDAPITAVEVRFIPFDIWGDKGTPLSSTTIQDINQGMWLDDGAWRISESDAVHHYAMIGYVAQIKTADGRIIKANPDLVVSAAKDFSDDFSTGDLSVTE